MTLSGKLQAEKAIESVKERGHTNLSGGLLAALETLYRQAYNPLSQYLSLWALVITAYVSLYLSVSRIPENEASLVESVLLFTDGKANVGIRTQAPLIKATR